MRANLPLRVGLAVVAALLTAGPGAGQRSSVRHQGHGEVHIVEQSNGRRFELRTSGRVELNEEGTWVAALEPGARFVVEEETPGMRRRAEFVGGRGGAVEVRYREGGRERPLDREARAWVERAVLRAVRESGIGAEARVARIRARGGVSAVLAEIGKLQGDVARRRYYAALLEGGRLSDAEFGRVMGDVRRGVRGDVERRLVLRHALDHAASGARVAAVLGAAEGMRSDVEVRLVLTHAAGRGRLDAPAAREAFFRAAESIDSDVERRLVLHAFLEHGGLDAAASRAAFLQAVDAMRSDVERRLVLTRVLEDGASEPVVLAALAAARPMRSDVEKRIVLSRVPAGRLRSGRVSAAYREVVETMGSDVERAIALRRLVRDL